MKLPAAALIALSLAACGDKDTGNTQSPPVAAIPAPAGQDWTQTVVKTAEGYTMGNPAAPLKLVEYGSRLCPTCGAFAREGFRPLTNQYVKSGKVSFEFREFLVHGPVDMPPALLGNCVGAQPFFPLLEQMFTGQSQFAEHMQAADQVIRTAPAAQRFSVGAETLGILDFVKQRGLPEAQARACLTNAAEIDRLTKQTQDNGPGGNGTVNGTPTFILNGKVVEGAISWAQVEQALKRAGA